MMEDEDVLFSPEKVVVEETNCEEQKKLSLLRAILEKKDPSCKDLEDPILRRFLGICDLDVEKACLKVTKYLGWRRKLVPKGFISESEVANQIAQNKAFMQGRDKQGRPIAVLLFSRHFPSKGGLDELNRSIPDGQDTFTIIGDFQGYGYSNKDFRGSLATINILQDYYPERLGKVYNIHVPYIYMTFWKTISPFIKKNARKKIVFVDNKKLHETLLEDIDESQLPEIYGGKLPLVPIHMAP
ncbi:cral-trio domain-containing protein c589.09 mitochondrial [Phtheirospermum japonicum]|uniref:Cral-trio domain-containing protein c589.09 mitochondrial n=1 Tax=Phtheirospermum japonicum TaxID=374723 RepID=A0A830D4K0_9LAMI|nr:cral-trio domain-containing protein c589.09 mitochondrial [Phtheirospermum japonicum]